MKALGLNIVGLSDFHFELHANDPGPLRFPDQKEYCGGFAARVRQGLSGDSLGRTERLLRRPLQHDISQARVLVEGAAAGSAVQRERSGLWEGLPYRQRGRRAAIDGCRKRLLVHGASSHEELSRISRRVLRHLREDRPVPWRRIQAGHGAWTCRTGVSANGGASTPPTR